MSCTCLEQCEFIKYSVEIVPHTLADYNISLERRQVDIDVTLNFRFKDVNVVAMRRYQPLTFVKFLAQSGGMMGLFVGISALSIIEIFYFLL
jgi:acid-sensing ion channel, other